MYTYINMYVCRYLRMYMYVCVLLGMDGEQNSRPSGCRELFYKIARG